MNDIGSLPYKQINCKHINEKYLKETAKYLLRCPLIISPYVVEIEKMYGMTSDELNRRNEEVFLRIFRNAYRKSPFYHRLYTETGIGLEDIKSLTDMEKLPIITKEMVKSMLMKCWWYPNGN